jgi:hypothetical protein
MLRSVISALFILICLSPIFPQEREDDPVSPGERLTAWLEEIASYEGNEYLISDFSSEIADLLANPVILNRGTEQEISRLFFLTWYQQQSLADYIRRMGSIVSVTEIAYLPGFDRELALLLEPFISLAGSTGRSYTITEPEWLRDIFIRNHISVMTHQALPGRAICVVRLVTTG